ncbi:MAG: diaminobutyrate acetyltransferase [Gammaproteobacteria bacterium]|nr:diaminobutyrate acetyltransferase [Pseudomonadales bacterium]MCP5347317.1 diaminobutyrate acetyltransferase [Pseudomonadales bacterium]
MSTDPKSVELRKPVSTDGARVHSLVSQCPPLDTNSVYCNLLQCSHFAETSIAAELDGEVAGFISAYRKPQQPDTLFVWQVAVGDRARGQGLASRMLFELLQRSSCQGVRWLETTITEANQASWALFRSLAGKLAAELNSSVMFDRETHFGDAHESELLVRIGPLDSERDRDYTLQ